MASTTYEVDEQLAGRYFLRERLGEGAMGQVWRVADAARGGQELALKTLGSGADVAKGGLLLRQEFRWMTQVRHPNCCDVFDFGQVADGTPFFTMEVVPGQGLDQLVPMAPAEVRLVLIQLLRALGYVHHLGFVHRDVKAANVRLRADGVVKLMDFGLMGQAGEPGALTGTLAYLAPEAIQRAPLDGRADLYAVGALCYELLTGVSPFKRDTVRACLDAHLRERPAPPSRLAGAVPPELDRVVLRLLEKDPARRYPSAAAVLAALGETAPPDAGGALLHPPLAGRAAEAEALLAALARTGRGEGGHGIWLEGPAGTGKGRLVAGLRVAAQIGGTTFATGVHEADRRPYGAIAGALRDLLPALRAHVPALLEAHAPVLAPILPELDARPAPALGDAGLERRRLHAAIAELWTALAAAQPFVVVLEDLQWAPPEALELLARLVPLADELPLTIVLTGRERPVGFAPPAGWTALPLGRLAPGAVAEVVAGMLGCEAAEPALLAAVEAASGGNPLGVVRAVEHLVRAGLLVSQAAGWRFDAEAARQAPLAQLPGDLRGLPADVRRVAHALAVLGGEAELARLARVTGLPDDGLLAALDVLRAERLVQAGPDGRHRFAEADVAAAIARGLDAGERRSIHEAVAAALRQAAGDVAPEALPLAPLTDLARHSLAGERPEAGVPLALEAGIRHARAFAVEEALALFRAALTAVEASPSPAWAPTRLAIGRHLGQLLHFAGQPAEARPALLAAERLAEALGDQAALADVRAAIARAALALGQPLDALAYGDRALAGFQAAGDGAREADALLTRAQAHLARGSYGDAMLDATAAVAAARGLDDPALLGKAHAAFAELILAGTPSLHGVALDHLERARACAQASGDQLALGAIHAGLGLAGLRAGDLGAAQAAHTQQLMASLEIGHADGYVAALAALADVTSQLGAPAEALKMLGDAQREALQSQAAGSQLECQLVAAGIQVRAGEFAGAIATLRRLDDGRHDAAGLTTGLRILAVRTACWLALGDPDEAWRAAQALHALCRRTGAWWVRVPLAAWRLTLVERLGLDEPLEDDRSTLAWATTHSRPADRLAALAACARSALAAGRLDEAMRSAEAGLALARATRAAYPEVAFLAIIGEAALGRGEACAADRFGELAARAAQLGAPDWRAQAAFGLAASRPYAPQANELAQQARTWLEDLAATLAPEDRAWFWAEPARARVRAGNHVGFGLPQARPLVVTPLGPGLFGGLGPPG